MKKLTAKQIRFLRSKGHSLKPVLQIGKAGITDAFLKQVTEALETHELIKIKVGNSAPNALSDSSELILQKTSSHLAQSIGKTMLLYKAREEKPEIILP